MSDPTPLTIDLVKFILGIVTAVVTVCAFIFDQFRRTREKAAKELSEFKRVIFRVVSRHNKEDDENFGAINDNLHSHAQLMARHLGLETPQFKTLRKRRYLVDDGGSIQDAGLNEGIAAGDYGNEFDDD